MQLRDVAITVDDGTVLHARIHDGDSPALILLHDLDCSATYWDAVVARLLAIDPDLHVIALDMRGHGRSTCAGETSRKRLVKDVRRVCKQLDLDAPVLCGHGWGADVALASESAGSVIAINPLFGRLPGAFSADVPRPAEMGGAASAELLASCRFGIEHAKRLRRSRRDAPLLLLAADPADTEAEAYPEIAEAAIEAYAWQEASRHLPLEAPAGIAALVLAWIEEVA
jgi:hypothetical protein